MLLPVPWMMIVVVVVVVVMCFFLRHQLQAGCLRCR